MKKKIWKDYWKIWRFRQISASWKDYHDFNSIWMPIYLLVILPSLWMGQMKGVGVIYYSYIIPLLLEYFTARRMPMGLPKVAYLVPMSAEDRTHYVTGMYWLKVAVPLVLSFAVMLPAAFCSLMGWYDLFFGILMQFLQSMVIQLSADMLSAEQKTGKLRYVAAWAIFAMCFGLFSLAAISLWIAADTVEAAVYGWVMAGIVCCQLLLTAKCMSYYRILVDSCMFYENFMGKNRRVGSNGSDRSVYLRPRP